MPHTKTAEGIGGTFVPHHLLPIWLQEVTQNGDFSRWFGNSQMTAHDGLPLVMCHGTPTRPSESNNKYVRGRSEETGDKEYPEFFEFDERFAGQTDSSWLGRAFYFTTDPDYAWEFGNVIMQCLLRVDRPFVIKDDCSMGYHNQYRFRRLLEQIPGIPENLLVDTSMPEDEVIKGHGGNEYPVFYSLVEGLNEQGENRFFILSSSRPNTDGGVVESEAPTSEEACALFHDKKNNMHQLGFLSSIITKHIGADRFTELVKAEGYDAAVLMTPDFKGGWKISEVAVYEPNQIKSVFNDGRFGMGNKFME